MGFGMNQKDEENPPQSGEDSDADVTASTRLKPSEGEEMEMKKIPLKTTDAGYPILIAGKNKPCIKTSILKSMLVGFNAILAVLGLVILVLSVWVRSDPVFWEYETTLNLNDFYKVCNMLIVAGIVMLLVGFLGCCGAINNSQWMLATYSVIFGIIFFLELASLALILIAPYNNTIRGSLEKIIEQKIKDREVDDQARYFTDFVQQNLHCCGSQRQAQKDYYAEIPNSCHDPKTGDVYQVGCANEMLKYLREKAVMIAAVSVPIILFHALALIVSVLLLIRIRDESSYPM